MSEDIGTAAAHWHVRQDDDDFDWAGFTDWLEADPRHRAAFDDIALLDDRIASHRQTLRALIAPEQPRSNPGRWRWMVPGAAAAAIAAGLVAYVAIPGRVGGPAAAPVRIEASASARKLRIGRVEATLAAHSVMTSTPGDATHLTVDGRAVFSVDHDPAHPVTVTVGQYQVTDVGTRFEVATGNGAFSISVAEGEVMVRSPGGARTSVVAGRSLTALPSGEVRVGTTTAPLGGWRSGPLVYSDAPLALVAADISRVTGRAVTVDPAVAGRKFSGILAPGEAAMMARSVAALTDVQVRSDGAAIRLGAATPR